MTDFDSSSAKKVQLAEPSYLYQSDLEQSNSAEHKNGSTLLTVGQLMRSTAQSIQHLYRDRLGHTPSRVTCDLIDNKLLVWAEDSVTRPEQVLSDVGSRQLLAVSIAIKEGLKTPLIALIERHLRVKVVTLFSDVCYQQKCTAMVVLLANPPRVRSSRNHY